jgi:hypothetical protein
MTKREAELVAAAWRRDPDVESAKVVRILSEIVDPPKDDDNGWDVEAVMKDEMGDSRYSEWVAS